MLNDRTKALVQEYNPWWENRPFRVPEYRRETYSQVEKLLGTKQIVAIVGLRRVGKTVLLRQLIKDLAVENKRNVLYFVFDDFLTMDPAILEDVITYFLQNVASEGQKYVFLDEIQKVPYWQDILKRFYDSRDDVKFTVTGSASLQLKKSKESLAGRVYDVHMPVLSFAEFLDMNGLPIEKPILDHASLQEVYEKNLHREGKLGEMFLEYLYKGAFPEIALEKDEDAIKSYVRNSVLEKVVYEDIPEVFSVRRKEVLYAIMEYACRETSEILDLKKLAATLEVNYLTARSHVFYLQNSFVLDLVYNYSKSAAKQLRKNKKVHVAHPCISVAMMGQRRDAFNAGETVGKYVETAVYQHCHANGVKLSFWRTPQKEEVDLILEDTMTPIEVKYKNKIDTDDTKNLVKFLNKYKQKRGFIVTKDAFGKKEIDGKEIIMVPAWLFLLTI